jgi:hypothetical protein
MKLAPGHSARHGVLRFTATDAKDVLAGGINDDTTVRRPGKHPMSAKKPLPAAPRRRSIARHYKLVEATGLLLVFSAWAADWSSARKWAEAEATFQHAVESLNYAADSTARDLRDNMHADITRSLARQEIDYSQPGIANRVSWASADVRHDWFLSALNEYYRATKIPPLLDELITDSGVRSAIDATEFNSNIELVTRRLKPILPDGVAPARFYPAESRISPATAESINADLHKLFKASLKLVNSAGAALRDAKNRASRTYRLLFAVGSAIVVLSKILDWQNARRVAANNQRDA